MQEIQKFFVDYMINDTLGAISTAHLVHADREPDKARSSKCLELAELHSMAVDFAKTGGAAEMPRALKPREFPDFMQRVEKPMYVSQGVLGKLYRDTTNITAKEMSKFVWSKKMAEEAYDDELEVSGFEEFLSAAESHKDMYHEKMSLLMKYYEVESEDEMVTGNMRNKAMFLQRDNRRYGEMKDRMLVSIKNLQREAREWFEYSCKVGERQRLASAWYHVTYHSDYWREGMNFLSFPWIVGNILLEIKSVNSREIQREKPVFSYVYVKSPRMPTPMRDESME